MPASEAVAPSGPDLVVDRLAAEPGNVQAVLFYGAEGAGMEEAAWHLARSWLCAQGGCGTCAVCKAFEGGRMVDLMVVRPWGPSSLIKRSAIVRSKRLEPNDTPPEPPLIEFFRTPPLMARHKVALFEQAHRMNDDAANALLKTLEEPPVFAKIILTTNEFSRILPTVRSRCLNVACPSGAPIHEADWTTVFAPSAGLARQVEAHRALYERLWSLFESSLTAPWGAAMALSERTRDVAEDLSKALKTNARAAHAETLRCLAAWLVSRRPDRPDLAQAAVEAHRLVLGNLNAGPLVDHLWATLLEP